MRRTPKFSYMTSVSQVERWVQNVGSDKRNNESLHALRPSHRPQLFIQFRIWLVGWQLVRCQCGLLLGRLVGSLLGWLSESNRECGIVDLVPNCTVSLTRRPPFPFLHSQISHLTELNGTHWSALCMRIGATGAPSIGHESDECRSHRDTQVAWN